MIRFTVFDRWGNQIGVVNDVIEAVHKDEINGEDSLTIVTPESNLVKGNRIVWRDKFLTWHEHIVNDIETIHADGRIYTTVYCENSINELLTDFIEELRPYDVTATVALQRALNNSRWEVGTVDVTKVSSASFYHISVKEAISLIIENWGGELSTTITIDGTGVASRRVNILQRRGADNGKRFEWTKDLESIKRQVSSDDVVTALYGYGKGIPVYDESGNATGGYSRRITFGEINGGKDYVTDETAKNTWGLPDGHGGIKHTFGKVEFEDCEDPKELLQLTKDKLKEMSKPNIVYSANVIDLANAGFEYEDVRTGDTVALIDRELDERLQGRVLSVERYLFNEQATNIELGNISKSILNVMADTQARLGRLNSRSSSWDNAASLSQSYINAVIDSLNNTMNATGGYTYYEPGDGIITYDKPKDQNPTMAIQIKGAGFRIANSKKSNGDWDWRTFGTGDGFTADEITAGTIKGGSNTWNLNTGDLHFEQGSINSARGGYWNLNNGEFETIYTISSSISATGSTYTRYLDTVIAVDMTASTPFGIYRGTRTRTVYNDGRIVYGALSTRTFIGGLYLNGDNAYLRASRAGTSDSNYITTGNTGAGNPGASFVNSSGNYLDIEALHATGSPSGTTNGVGMACFDKPFLDVSTYFNRLWMYPPTYSQTYLQQPPEQLYLGRNSDVYLQRSSNQGLFCGNGYTLLQHDATHYVRITPSGVECRCGSKGFGWIDGKFSDSLTWN